MNMNGVFDDLNNNDRQNGAASDLFRSDESVCESNTYGGVYADKDKLDRLKNAAYKYTREGRPRDIEYRTVCLANYIVENKCTVRDAAKAFGVSKSTVHKDVTQRLGKINRRLAEEVGAVLLKNKNERHIRGGCATREKYKQRRKTPAAG